MTDATGAVNQSPQSDHGAAEREGLEQAAKQALAFYDKLERPHANGEAAVLDALDTALRRLASRPPEVRMCGYCHSWHSKPCGEGCHWSPSDPTLEQWRADDLKAKRKHNRKHPLPVTFER